jgi:8-oxo-dGTP diphosphatase
VKDQFGFLGLQSLFAARKSLSDWPRPALTLLQDVTRHVLRRPVLGVAAVATTGDARVVLVRRRDTGQWALPGGTLEWGETLQACITRELREEAGVNVERLGELSGVYSGPLRDYRFHAVTVVVTASVSAPLRAPVNPLEIIEVGLFDRGQLPELLSLGMTDMLHDALHKRVVWE